MDMEKTLAELERRVEANALTIAVVSLELHLYKARIAKQRWGSPGGNDVALLELEEARHLVTGTDWPAEVRPAADAFVARLDSYVKYLKAFDVTRVSFEESRLDGAFTDLERKVKEWGRAGTST